MNSEDRSNSNKTLLVLLMAVIAIDTVSFISLMGASAQASTVTCNGHTIERGNADDKVNVGVHDNGDSIL